MADKQAIFEDFMKGELTVPQIAEKHSVSLDTVKNWAYRNGGVDGKSWKMIKSEMENEMIHQAVNAGSTELSLAWKAGADIYMKWLDKVNNGLEAGAFSAKELVQLGKTIPDGLKVLHPMLRLEMNKSTSNVEVQQSRRKEDDLLENVPEDLFTKEVLGKNNDDKQ